MPLGVSFYDRRLSTSPATVFVWPASTWPGAVFPPIISTLIRRLIPQRRGVPMGLSTDLIEKLALPLAGGVLIALMLRAGARWLMRSLMFIGILTALYLGAQALGVFGK